MLAAAAALAACEGTVGTVEDSGSVPATTVRTVSTSGAGGDTVSGTRTTAAGTDDSATITSSTAPRHPLDDPASPLGTHTIYFASKIRATCRRRPNR